MATLDIITPTIPTTISPERHNNVPKGASDRRQVWPPPVAALVLGVVLSGAQLLHGANDDVAHLILDASMGFVLLCSLAFPRSRESLTRDQLVWTVAVLFMIPIGLGAASLFGPYLHADRWAPTTVDCQDTTLELFHLMGLGGCFLCARIACRNVAGAELFGRTLLVGFATAAVVGLSGYIAMINATGGHLSSTPRLDAGFSSPNSAATLMAVGALWGGAVLLQSRRIRRDELNMILLLGWLAFIPCTIALLLTLSRAGISCGAIVFALLIVQAVLDARAIKVRRTGVADAIAARFGPVLAMLILLGATLAIAAAIENGAFAKRVAAASSDWNGREILYAVQYKQWLEHPLFGWGLGAFDIENRALLQPDSYLALWQVRAAHDIALQWLVTGGLVATIAMGAVLVLLLRAAWAGARTHTQPWSCAIAFSAGFILLHGSLDYGLEEPSIAMLFAAILGMGAAMRPTRVGRANKPHDKMMRMASA